MERLEAAIEKAREKRNAAQVETPVELKDVVVKKNTGVAAWKRLGEMRISKRAARNNRISTLKTGALAGPFDMLRSRSLRIMNENGWKRLAITSPNSSCGKTTSIVNLAISLARQSDLKIIVFDMDMRRPGLNKVLGHKGEHSLHDLIDGMIEPQDLLVRLGKNLAFAGNSRPSTHPSELLQSKRTRNFLDEIQETYNPDLMLFDMPPMLSSDDNVSFLPAVDCALLVGAAEGTKIGQLDNCEKELAELTNVLGIVLNKCRYSDPDGGYDYY